MARPVNMNAILYFEAVARHSRVNLAAEELMVSPSAVSQQVKSLEEQLGVLLFRRVKRGLVLTEEGERFYGSANKALGLLRDAQDRAQRTRESRRLVIRVAASFGVRWLGRRLADFVHKNPGIELHVDATSEITDFEKESVDLEIRYGPEPPDGLHAESLITDMVLPMSTPRIAAAAEVGMEECLSATQLIHTVKAFATWRDWLDRQGLYDIDGNHGLRFDRSSMSLQAAVDGLGIVLETATLAMDELRNGQLVPLAPHAGTLTFPTYWLSCPVRHLNRRAVKAFATWIAAQAAAHEAEKRQLLASLGTDMETAYFSQLAKIDY